MVPTRDSTLTSDARTVEWMSTESSKWVTATMDSAGLSDGDGHTIARANFSILAAPYGDEDVIAPDGGPWSLHSITATSGNDRDSQPFKLRLLIPLNVAIGSHSGTITFSAETVP